MPRKKKTWPLGWPLGERGPGPSSRLNKLIGWPFGEKSPLMSHICHPVA